MGKVKVMSRPFQVEIVESCEVLEKVLKSAKTASSKERLQMLYLLKSGQVKSRQEWQNGSAKQVMMHCSSEQNTK